ncbi:MAG: pilin [Solirubrobacterales bacterium]
MPRVNRQAGFTIIEVMIVTMIIGVLAALVLPSIRLNTARVKLSEALLASAPCRNMVSELYVSGGDPPGPNSWGCEVTSNASTYVDSVTTDDLGMITVSLRGFNDLRIDFHDLTLMPLDNTGSPPSGAGSQIRRWRCGSPVDGTSVPSQFLPNSCRG